MLNSPPFEAADESPPLSSPPPQAVISIAPTIVVATSALLRLLNFTCNASLNPRLRGERTGRPELVQRRSDDSLVMSETHRDGRSPIRYDGWTLGTGREGCPRTSSSCDLRRRSGAQP